MITLLRAAHAAGVASQIQLAEQDAARVAAAKAAAERAVADAEAQIDWAMTVTEEAKVARKGSAIRPKPSSMRRGPD